MRLVEVAVILAVVVVRFRLSGAGDTKKIRGPGQVRQ